ncbi:MAG: hypothetical protein ACK5JS_06640 [Mangrovibacterium sp.]
MKKFRFLFMLVIVLGISVAACKKDNGGEEPIPPVGICDDDSYVINFLDANLKSALLEKLGKSDTENITCGDAKKVKSLDLEAMGIKNMEGIEYFINLDSLSLALNPISNYALVDSLNLLYLNKDYEGSHIVTFNDVYVEELLRKEFAKLDPPLEVAEAEPLTYDLLKKLEKINLSDNPRMKKFISGDLEGLQFCTNVSSLTIMIGSTEEYPADRVDLTPVKNMANVETSRLRGIDFTKTSLEALGHLASIEELTFSSCLFYDFDANKGADLSPLSKLTKIKTLNLSGVPCALLDMTPLNTLVNIEQLMLNNTMVKDENGDVMPFDISFLSGATKLKNCNLIQSGVRNLSPLESCDALEILYLGGNGNIEASSMSTLNSKPNLIRLGLEGCGMTNNGLAALLNGANWPKLIILGLGGNEFTDLSPIKSANIPYFTSKSASGDNGTSLISLANAKVTELSPLGDLVTLQSLELDKAAIISFTGLEKLKLTELYANDTEVSDLSPLANITSLKEMELSRTLITTLNDLHKLTKLELLQINKTAISVADQETFEAAVPGCVVTCYGRIE